MRKAVESYEFNMGGRSVSVTISIGISSFPESPVEDKKQLIEHADSALYEAKRGGRNRTCVYGKKS